MKYTKEELEFIAKCAISAIMCKSVYIMTAETKEEFIEVNYYSSLFEKECFFKVKFEKEKIIWDNLDGRWRDHTADEKISFKSKTDKVIIIQDFKHSKIKNEYKK